MVQLPILRKYSSINKKTAKHQLKKQTVSDTITENFRVFFGILKQLLKLKMKTAADI